MQHQNIPGNQNMGRHLRLAAYFYPANRRRNHGILEFYRINDVSGGQKFLEGFPVADKHEARKIADIKGFTPWNF